MTRLYFRMFAWFIAANLLTLVLTAVITDRVAKEMYGNQQLDWGIIAETTANRYVSGDKQDMGRWLDLLRRRGIDAWIIDPKDWETLDRVPRPIRHHPELLAAGTEVRLQPNNDITMVAQDVTASDGRVLRFIGVHKPPEPRDRPRIPLMVQLLTSMAVIALIGWLVARSISRPVAAIQKTARQMASGALNARVGSPITDGKDEISQLARDFDAMAERIERSVTQMRGLLQDVSHELRSPLARLQIAMELARRAQDEHGRNQALSKCEREVERLDRSIGQTLALARLESGLPDLATESVGTDELIEDCIGRQQTKADERNIALLLDIAGLQLEADPALIGRVLDNLVDNAIKFSPTGTEIRIDCHAQDEWAVIRVADQGPGVPEDELPRLFQPFVRGQNAYLADGQGLGLAIVERIARSHHGEVRASANTPKGLTVEIRLPLPSPV